MGVLTEGEGLSHGADDREVVWELLCRKRKTRLVASRWGVTHKGEAPSSLSLPPCPLILCSSTRPATQHPSVEHLPCHVSRYLPSSLSLSLTPPSSLSPCNYRSRLPSSDRIPPLPRISTSVWPHPASAPHLYICIHAFSFIHSSTQPRNRSLVNRLHGSEVLSLVFLFPPSLRGLPLYPSTLPVPVRPPHSLSCPPALLLPK